MNHYFYKGLVLILILAGIFCFISCENSVQKNEVIGIAKTEENERLAIQIDFALAQRVEWKSHWESRVGTLKSSDFILVLTDSLQTIEMPERNPIQIGDPLFPFQILHPKGLGTMDIYGGKIEISENLTHLYYNPDSEVNWYRSDGMRARLLIMGPSGLFEEGIWINENEFLVLGFFQFESGFKPMIWILDIKNQLMRQFQFQKSILDYDSDSYINSKIKFQDLG